MDNYESFKTATQVNVQRSFPLFRSRRFHPPSVEIVKAGVRFSDGMALLAACTVERIPEIQQALSSTADHNHLLANIVGGCIAFGVMGNHEGYKIRVLKKLSKQIKRIAVSIVAGTAGVYTSLLMMHQDPVGLITGPLRWAFVSAALLATTRTVITPIIREWADSGRLAKRIAIVGVNEISQRFIDRAALHSDTCKVVAMYDDRASRVPTLQGDVKLRGGFDQILPDSQIDMFDSVVITLPFDGNARINDIFDKVFPVIADIQVAGRIMPYVKTKRDLNEVGGNVVVTVFKRPLNPWQTLQKNIFDKVVASTALLMFSPVLLITAILIKLDSPGRVLFRQPRVGYNNLMFDMIKFRTMHAHMEDKRADVQTTENDPRITRVGKFLRKYSIDELTQLINVVKGDMSLVGPRPHAPGTKADGKLFPDVVPEYPLRHRVKPGITGLAQVSGYRGETKTVDAIQKRVEYDLLYIQNWSLLLDIKIICLTVLREIKSKSAF